MTEYSGEKSPYIAYHNSDINLASQITIDLIMAGFGAWYDRFQIAPKAQWEKELLRAITTCHSALLLLSKAYLDSDYGQAELNQLNQRDIKLYILILDDIALDNFTSLHQNHDIIDFQSWRQEAQYQSACRHLLACFDADNIPNYETPRVQNRLYQTIAHIETRLQQSLTGLVGLQNNFNNSQNVLVRPRGYSTQSALQNGQYFFQEVSDPQGLSGVQGSELRVENLLECMAHFQCMILTGQRGSGKSYLLYLLMLEFLHQYLMQNSSSPYPLFIHLLAWDKRESLSDFVFKQAQRQQVETQYALFLDGMETVTEAEHRLQLLGLLNTNAAQTIVISCDWDALADYSSLSIPIIRLPDWSEGQALQLVKPILGTDEASNFINDLYPQANTAYPAAYIAFKLLERFDIDRSLQSLCRHFGEEEWRTTKEKLAYLAFVLYDADYGHYAPRPFILLILEDENFLKALIAVGILEGHGASVSFTSNLLQDYFAAQYLMLEGLYTRLLHPHFDENHLRIPRVWDAVIMMSLDLLAANETMWHIESIAEVDPFLAFNCMRYCQISDAHLQRSTLEKLLDSRRDWRRMTATIRGELEALPDTMLYLPFLLQMLADRDWSKRQLALEIVLALHSDVSDSFVADLKNLERGFPESVFTVIGEYGEEQSVFWLLHLSLYEQETICSNAIWSLGELGEAAAVPLYLTLLDTASQNIVIEILRALGKIGDDTITEKLLRMCRHNIADVSEAATWALNSLNQPLTAKLINFLIAANDDLSETFLHTLASTPEESIKDILKALLTPESTPRLDESKRLGNMNELLQLLADKFNTLRNRSAFNDFVEDVTSSISATDETGKKRRIETLKQRIIMSTEQSKTDADNSIEAQALSTEEAGIPQDLLLDLVDDNWLIRLKTVHALAQYPSETVLSLLMDAAQDLDCQIRAAAIEHLGKMRNYPITIDILLNALDDAEYLVIDAATDALKERGSGVVFGLLRKLTASRIETLAAVIDVLGYVGDDATVEQLLPYLEDERTPWLNDRTLGDIAAQSLVSIGTPQALEALQQSGRINYAIDNAIIPPDAEHHKESKDPTDLSPNEKVTILLKALHSPQWERSQKAARYLREYAKKLRKLNDDNIRLQLTEALTDSNWVVRWTAAESLAWLSNETAIPYLEATLNDNSWIVRVAAVNALVVLKAENVINSLAILLSDENQAVREATVEAISLLGGGQALVHLKRAIQDEDDFVRLAAVRGITTLDDEYVIPLLTEVLDDEYSHVRWFAIKRLAATGDSNLVRHFAARLGDKDGPGWEDLSISDFAQEGLMNIGTSQSQKVLQKWGNNGENEGNRDNL
jgi:HEAT repeat protein